MQEPLYGFIVEVTVSENQTCQIMPPTESNPLPQCQIFSDEDSENEIDATFGKKHTVWHFHDFSAIQILREINFGESRSLFQF